MKDFIFCKQRLFFCLTAAVFLSLIISCSGASKSDSRYSSSTPIDVYVGGRSYTKSAGDGAVYWKNGEMVALMSPYEMASIKPKVTSIAVLGNDIYAGGYCGKLDPSIPSEYMVESVTVPCYWKNGKFIELSKLSKYDSEVSTIFVIGDDVYAGGDSENKSKVRIAGYWKNQKWVPLVPVNSKYNSRVDTIFVSGDDVYAGGHNNSADGIPGYWKNGEWITLPSLTEKKEAGVSSIFVSGNDVYACGYSKNNLGVRIACYWKNDKIIPLLPLDCKCDFKGFLVFQCDSKGSSIFVSGKDVYVGGYTKNDLGNEMACYWKNGKLTKLTPSENSRYSAITSIFVFGNDIYAGGYCSVSGKYVAGYWKNGKWIELNTEGKASDSYVNSIVVVARPAWQ